ncbi:hypothetical protein ACN6LA_002439 [Streptomyces sp. SAS_269]|uniref:hypothetical protein n=1 Tax=Streptomyces sp. SAS_269 TaxID=3412749 RepID=UPI00403C6ABA
MGDVADGEDIGTAKPAIRTAVAGVECAFSAWAGRARTAAVSAKAAVRTAAMTALVRMNGFGPRTSPGVVRLALPGVDGRSTAGRRPVDGRIK